MAQNPRGNIEEINKRDLNGLIEKATELHGYYCPGLAFGIKAGYRAVVELDTHSTGMGRKWSP